MTVERSTSCFERNTDRRWAGRSYERIQPKTMLQPALKSKTFFYAVLAFALYVTYVLLRPYLGVVIFSIVIVLVFRPVYRRYLLWFRKRQGVAIVPDYRYDHLCDPDPGGADHPDHDLASDLVLARHRCAEHERGQFRILCGGPGQ